MIAGCNTHKTKQGHGMTRPDNHFIHRERFVIVQVSGFAFVEVGLASARFPLYCLARRRAFFMEKWNADGYN
jgi:hypothetical protein